MTTGTYGVYLDTYNHAGKSWSGSDTPKVFEWDRRGKRFVRPRVFSSENGYYASFDMRKHERYARWGKVSGQWVKTDRTYVTGLCPALSVTEAFDALNALALDSDLTARALNKLSDSALGTEFHMGNAVGTIRQTLGTVASLAVGVIQAHKAVRRGDIPGAMRSLIRGVSGAMAKDTSRNLNRQRGRLRKKLESDLNRLNSKRSQIQHLDLDVLALSQKIRLFELDLVQQATNVKLRKALTKAVKRRRKLLRDRSTLASDPLLDPIALKDLSATWLAMQYGWLPLVSDVWEGAQFLDAEFDRQSMTVKGSAKVSATGFAKISAAEQRPRWYGRHQVELRAHLKRLPNTAERLGLNDPLSVVWELTPFSFIVDWFIQVGDWLRSRSVTPLLEQSGWKTRFLLASSKNGNHFPYPGTNPAYDPWAGSGSVYTNGIFDERSINIWREPIVFADVRPSTKSLSNAFSLPHIQNAAALIHQAVS